MVAAAIWRTAVPRLGMLPALRALTAWWREPAELQARFGARVIAATLERAVCYWGNAGPGGYDQAALAYDIPADEARKAGVPLQKALKLSSTQPW